MFLPFIVFEERDDNISCIDFSAVDGSCLERAILIYIYPNVNVDMRTRVGVLS